MDSDTLIDEEPTRPPSLIDRLSPKAVVSIVVIAMLGLFALTRGSDESDVESSDMPSSSTTSSTVRSKR